MFLNEDQIQNLIPKQEEIEKLFDKLWPICRSITGNGIRQSFDILNSYIPLKQVETPTGTEVFDWVIPREWNVVDAYVINPDGKKILQLKENNLHLVNYSIPFKGKVSLEELQKHLHSLPNLPTAIPYVTSYYKDYWGFCLTHPEREALKEGDYEIYIETSLTEGSLTYGHTVLPSTTGNTEEFLISTYLCHPSMANNELSGPIVTAFLYQMLAQIPNRHYNYRFIFVPETIGSITYLKHHGDKLKEDCIGGLVVTCCGDDKALMYKKTKHGNTAIDKIAMNLINHSSLPNKLIRDFFPTGSDERQYNSPGFNLPVGSITRSMYGKYEEYHTSLDNKDFISFKGFQETLEIYLKTILTFENNDAYINTSPHGEPMLGKRGLYSSIGASKSAVFPQQCYLYLLSYSDGHHDIVDIANKMNISAYDLVEYVEKLKNVDLLRRE